MAETIITAENKAVNMNDLPEELREKVTPKRMKVRKKRVNRSLGGDIGVILLLTIMGLFMGVPLYYTIISAFKPLNELFIFPPRFYVSQPTLTNFKQVFDLASNLWVPFSRYVFNSIFVSVVVTVGHVILASMAAYPLEKAKFPGSKGLFSLVQLTLLFTGRNDGHSALCRNGLSRTCKLLSRAHPSRTRIQLGPLPYEAVHERYSQLDA